jgi:hypothetical protein
MRKGIPLIRILIIWASARAGSTCRPSGKLLHHHDVAYKGNPTMILNMRVKILLDMYPRSEAPQFYYSLGCNIDFFLFCNGRHGRIKTLTLMGIAAS